MQIILKENIENLGFKDDLVKVKNGYGRNYLIPQGKAVLATTSAKKVLAENLKQKAYKEKKIIDDAKALGEKLTALVVKIPSKVGSGDKLFGSVSAADLLKAFDAFRSSTEMRSGLFAAQNFSRTGGTNDNGEKDWK